MSSVVGLFTKAGDLPRGIQKIQETGFCEEDFLILSNEKAIKKIRSYKPTCVLTKYARWGAFTGIMIFGIPTLISVLCSYDLFSHSYSPGSDTFIAIALVGAGIGAILGLFICTAEFEKIVESFTQGVQKGGKVMLVQANEKDCEEVQIILRQAGSVGVLAISEQDGE